MPRTTTLAAILVITVCPVLASPAAADKLSRSKTRALLVTGGCCHEDQNQNQLISEGHPSSAVDSADHP